MFTMVETSRTVTTGSSSATTLVFRDKVAGVTVIQNVSHRGGCLYTGTVLVRNNNTGEFVEYHTTSAPMDAEAAGNRAWYRRDKIGF